MVDSIKKAGNPDIKLKLLGLTALAGELRNGISVEELYIDAERKFDTLIELMNGHYADSGFSGTDKLSLHDLKQASQSILRRLISNTGDNPYITLCVRQGASPEEIRSRRNKLLHIFHPDRNGESLANEIMTKKINEAYERIINTYGGTGTVSNETKINIAPGFPYSRRIFKKNNKLLFYFVVIIISLLTVAGLFKLLFDY